MKKSVVMILVACMVAACSSTPPKEAPKVAAPAPVVEQPQPATAEPTPPPAPTNTAPAVEAKTMVNPLTDPSNILSKRSIYFDFDKFEVKPEFRALVEAHAKYLNEHPQANVVLQGNADERGSREYNLALGQKRSVAVRKALNVLGVPDKQIETISYGKEKPRALGHDEASWAENRRVDIVYQGE